MKKSTQLLTYFQKWISKFLAEEKPNLKENEEKIMYLLKWGNGSKLSIQETIKLFQSIEERVNNDVSAYKKQAIDDLKAISEFNDYDSRFTERIIDARKQNVREMLNNPIFNKPLAEIEVDYKEITFDKKQ